MLYSKVCMYIICIVCVCAYVYMCVRILHGVFVLHVCVCVFIGICVCAYVLVYVLSMCVHAHVCTYILTPHSIAIFSYSYVEKTWAKV